MRSYPNIECTRHNGYERQTQRGHVLTTGRSYSIFPKAVEGGKLVLGVDLLQLQENTSLELQPASCARCGAERITLTMLAGTTTRMSPPSTLLPGPTPSPLV